MEIWAKSNRTLLKEHVRNLLEAFKYLPFDKIKVFDRPPLNQEKFKKLLCLAVIVHDFGKVSPTFQKETLGNKFYPIEIENFPNVRHNILSLFFINKEKIKELCEEDESLYAIFLSAVAFHHWKKDEKEYLLGLDENLRKAAELLLKDNGKKLEKALKEHFSDFSMPEYIRDVRITEYISFDEHLALHISNRGNLLNANIIPPYTLYYLPERLRLERKFKLDLNVWIFFSGFLMRMDHYCSSVERKDVRNVSINLHEIEKIVKNKIEKELEKKFGKDFWQKIAKRFSDKNLILIAPTGIGKTEFAFLWAEGEKLFYTLPLRVATNQIFERACELFNVEVSEKEEDPFINGNVGLLHSDADLYLYERWESSRKDIEEEIPKVLDLSRHFSLPVNICTGDQIFPAALKYPQYEKIYSTLGYSKLIVDEVQAYDPQACAVITKMIEDIVALGGKFLLITATLPNFIKDYLIKKNIVQEEEILNYYSEIKDIFRHKIELRKKDISEDLDFIIKKAKEGSRVLIVVNTIKKAQEIYSNIRKKLENQGIFIELIHSRFTINERKRKEKVLEEKFKNPKSLEEREPKILVATQVVEASLDIDADYLFTEIAPIDALIQRMGRIMRRVDLLTGKIKNLDKEFKYHEFYPFGCSNIYIYYQEEIKGKKERVKESGEGRVYEQILLKETLRVLKEKSEIKEREKQSLVEEVYKHVENSEYLKKFYQTISILDAGYVSDKREEAYHLFREIYTIPLVEEKKVKDIAEKIKEEKELTWVWFKREIIAEYVINDYIWNYRDLNTLWNVLREKLEEEVLEKNLEKLRKYCEGIYVFSEGSLKDNII